MMYKLLTTSLQLIVKCWVGARLVMAENIDPAPQQTFQLPISADESEPDKSSRMNIKDIVFKSTKRIGYTELKCKQVEAICSFIRGNDVFVSLPTGYGKSLIYTILPGVYDRINGMFTVYYRLY